MSAYFLKNMLFQLFCSSQFFLWRRKSWFFWRREHSSAWMLKSRNHFKLEMIFVLFSCSLWRELMFGRIFYASKRWYIHSLQDFIAKCRRIYSDEIRVFIFFLKVFERGVHVFALSFNFLRNLYFSRFVETLVLSMLRSLLRYV